MTYVRAIVRGEDRFALKAFWNYVVLDRGDYFSGATAEYTNLVVEDPEDLEDAELKAKDVEESSEAEPIHVRRARVIEPIQTGFDEHEDTVQWAQNVRRHARHPSYPHSAVSERTLFGSHSPRRSSDSFHESDHVYPWQGKDKRALVRFIGRVVFATTERVLVFAGFLQVVTGIVIYTGGCRANWGNGCLAHLISAYLDHVISPDLVLIVAAAFQRAASFGAMDLQPSRAS